MNSRQKFLLTAMLLVPMILCVRAFGYVVSDDDVPEVTARVARITFVSGDTQIRRLGNTDWERATADLPVVEGDEIATGTDARVEIQLNSFGYLRLENNSYLRISTLKDEGVAVSLSQGSMSARFLDFDKDKSYFEIDAPKTTVAVQKAGIYRVDAGSDTDDHVRVAATESGEARVYSENSGFTLKNGRSAVINIDGDLAGEWETAAASKFSDEFDSWSLDRDAAIAKKLNDAYYDKYYDRDIYGAEDLDNNGEWIHTNGYGYVWRPYQNVIAQYADWSPYRYGEWRWVPPFGWTWVNDEPWGWATYHHGRWFYDNGFWYWSPYGYYRNSRSWWSPALVVLTTIADDFCWYPLPYQSTYYDCNWYFHRGGRGGQWGHHGQQAGTPPPVRPTGPDRLKGMPYYRVPPGGVVTTPGGTFGTGRSQIRKAPPEIAKSVLDKDPGDETTVPKLPKIGDISNRMAGRIKVEKPIERIRDKTVVTGAIERKTSNPLDDQLRITRVMDKRPPAQPKSDDQRGRRAEKSGTAMRDTGAVGRPTSPPSSDPEPVKSIPPRNRENPPSDPPSGNTGQGEPKRSIPSKSVEPRNDPPKREEPRSRPPSRSEPTKSEPMRSEPTRSEPTRSEPTRSEPTRSEPTRSEPTKSEPSRSQPSSPEPSRKKDG